LSDRRKWNWREELTADERRAIAPYERAMEKVRDAQAEAGKHRLTFLRIQNRALGRAKYRAALRAAAPPEQQKGERK
jgi:hypothetical protein